MSEVLELNEVVLESPSSSPKSASFSEDCLLAAEDAAERVLSCVLPTRESEVKRKRVIKCIQKLLKDRANCQVFPYGSMPLKTYLPEGDIDLAAIRAPRADPKLAEDVLKVLNEVEPEYQVRDVQLINAKVKVVKCLVQNIVVDISFNKLDGIFTLRFLEQVNHVVERDHLFKRSIVLVKAWCFYESRTLGAQHGLISTYALETLILFILHLFHLSLSGPLSVLYKFLEYYGKFDWETYCISLKEPVSIWSKNDKKGEQFKPDMKGEQFKPDMKVKIPKSGLLKEVFLTNCMKLFPAPSSGPQENKFYAKSVNIVDPVNKNNNIGHTVSEGNSKRIRFAFKYGARQLSKILSQPRDKVGAGVSRFFANTLDRHGRQLRSIIQRVPVKNGGMHTELPFPECDTASTKFESFKALDDLSVHYTIHIESLKCAQTCLARTSSATIADNPPVQNQLSQINSTTVTSEQDLCPSSDSAGIQNQLSQINSPTISVKQDFRPPSNSAGIQNQLSQIDSPTISMKRDVFSAGIQNQLSQITSPTISTEQDLCPSTNSAGIQNQLSQTNSMEQDLYASSDSASLVNASGSGRNQGQYARGTQTDRRQHARGTQTYVPRRNDSYRERPPQVRGRNGATGNNTGSLRYVPVTGSERNDVDGNDTREVPPGQIRERNDFGRNGTREVGTGRGRGRTYMPRQSRPPAGNVNRTDDNSDGSFEIEFGTVGNLAKELLSQGANRGSTTGETPKAPGTMSATKQESDAGAPMRRTSSGQENFKRKGG